MTRESDRAVRVTATDRWIMRTLARYGGTTMPVLLQSVFSDKDPSGVYRRLRRLARIGLLENLKDGPSNAARPISLSALFVPTTLGCWEVETDLRARPLSVATAVHTVVISDIGLAAERAGLQVYTDREIQLLLTKWRLTDERRPPVPPLWLGEYDGSALSDGANLRAKRMLATHRPDLVIVDQRSGRRLLTAVEVEFSAKGTTSLRSILRWYVREATFETVRYVVRNAAEKRRVERALAGIGSWGSVKFEVAVYVATYAAKAPVPATPGPTFGDVDEGGLPDGADIGLPVSGATGASTPPPKPSRPFGDFRPGLPTRPPMPTRAVMSEPLAAQRGEPGANGRVCGGTGHGAEMPEEAIKPSRPFSVLRPGLPTRPPMPTRAVMSEPPAAQRGEPGANGPVWDATGHDSEMPEEAVKPVWMDAPGAPGMWGDLRVRGKG